MNKNTVLVRVLIITSFGSIYKHGSTALLPVHEALRFEENRAGEIVDTNILMTLEGNRYPIEGEMKKIVGGKEEPMGEDDIILGKEAFEEIKTELKALETTAEAIITGTIAEALVDETAGAVDSTVLGDGMTMEGVLANATGGVSTTDAAADADADAAAAADAAAEEEFELDEEIVADEAKVETQAKVETKPNHKKPNK